MSILSGRVGRARRPGGGSRGDTQGGAPVRGVRDRVLVHTEAKPLNAAVHADRCRDQPPIVTRWRIALMVPGPMPFTPRSPTTAAPPAPRISSSFSQRRRVRGSLMPPLEGRGPAFVMDSLVAHERAAIGIVNHLAADRANHVALRVSLIGHQTRGFHFAHRLEEDSLAARSETLVESRSRRRPLNTRGNVQWLGSWILAADPGTVNWTKVAWTKVVAASSWPAPPRSRRTVRPRGG